MAFCTVRGELLSYVVWIRGGVIVIGMATGTGIGRIVIIAVVAGCTVVGNGCVSPDQLIEVIVTGKVAGAHPGSVV